MGSFWLKELTWCGIKIGNKMWKFHIMGGEIIGLEEMKKVVEEMDLPWYSKGSVIRVAKFFFGKLKQVFK